MRIETGNVERWKARFAPAHEGAATDLWFEQERR